LASIRDGGDFNNVALDGIGSWIRATANDPDERLRAYAFRALANYTFGYFPDSVRDAEKALEYVGAINNANIKAGVKMNLAYFMAEEFYHSPSASTLDTKYARVHELMSDAGSLLPEHQNAFEDTRGAIEIAFGKSEELVRAGLHRCYAARSKVAQKTPEWAAADAFYRLHEHRACHRLLEWE
jgi:hypothetical protein